jgi:23S rRNA (uracil1939-C5)-methyltransferase
VRLGLARVAPEVLVYVSCNPTTLARDLAHLARLGLRAERVEPWDLIPLSDAVETLAVLRPSSLPPPRVLFEDEALIAIEKPPFLPTTPQGEYEDSLLARVRRLPRAARAVPVHRLDRGTSGVCLFARAPEAVPELAEALARGTKRYVALVRGVTHKGGRISRPLREGPSSKAAVTRYRRERVVGTHSLVEVAPEHGRRHQIRRHFASIGHPVLGDERYGRADSNRYFEEKHALDRPFLHCREIELELPARSVRLVSELAADLTSVLESLSRTAGARADRAATPGPSAPSVRAPERPSDSLELQKTPSRGE